MVEVDGFAILVGHLGGVVVIAVERHNGHVMGRQGLNYFSYDSGFTRTGATCNTNNGYIIFHFLYVF